MIRLESTQRYHAAATTAVALLWPPALAMRRDVHHALELASS